MWNRGMGNLGATIWSKVTMKSLFWFVLNFFQLAYMKKQCMNTINICLRMFHWHKLESPDCPKKEKEKMKKKEEDHRFNWTTTPKNR